MVGRVSPRLTGPCGSGSHTRISLKCTNRHVELPGETVQLPAKARQNQWSTKTGTFLTRGRLHLPPDQLPQDLYERGERPLQHLVGAAECFNLAHQWSPTASAGTLGDGRRDLLTRSPPARSRVRRPGRQWICVSPDYPAEGNSVSPFFMGNQAWDSPRMDCCGSPRTDPFKL